MLLTSVRTTTSSGVPTWCELCAEHWLPQTVATMFAHTVARIL